MLAPLPDLAPTLAALVLAATAPIAPLEVETDPALAFLASQTSAKGRRAQASALGLVAAVFGSTREALPWHALRHPHVAALRARYGRVRARVDDVAGGAAEGCATATSGGTTAHAYSPKTS